MMRYLMFICLKITMNLNYNLDYIPNFFVNNTLDHMVYLKAYIIDELSFLLFVRNNNIRSKVMIFWCNTMYSVKKTSLESISIDV